LKESSLVRCLHCYNIATFCHDANGNLVLSNFDEKPHICLNMNIINKSDGITSSRLIDELFLLFIRTYHQDYNTGELKRTYLEQAKDLIYKIPVYNPPPVFQIHLSDILNEKIKHDLAELDDPQLDDVMRDSIGRIFETIDERYYNLSVRNLLRWKIVA
jgi:hypothetical protein